jgi:micrococcal nuclease
MKESPLSASEYRALLKDVKKMVALSKERPTDTKLAAYWSIGELITAAKIDRGAGYFSSVIKDLSADVGLAGRTLYDAVQFFEANAEPPRDQALTWTHHRLLLKLSSKKARAFYIAELKKQGWSSRELEAAIAAGLHEGGPQPSLVLKRPTRPDYLYGAQILEVIDGDTLQLEIDLGFDVFRKIRVRLAGVDAPEISSSKGRAARDFLTAQLMQVGTCAVQTVRLDLHGRYVVHLFTTARRVSIGACFQNGRYLNDLLVQNKHAKVVAPTVNYQ